MDEERVEESPDASMIDSTQFPAISDQRPRRRFLGVQVPTSTVKPGFHLGKRLQRSRLNSQPQAIEILGEEQTGEGDFVFVFFDDNIVRRLPAKPFLVNHRGIVDNYIERKVNGALLPFDYSGGPPYVHPESRERYLSKTKSQHSRTSSGGVTTGSSVPSEDEEEDSDADDLESPQLTESSSEGYEEEENVEGIRRSARTQKPKNLTSLFPSPRKTRARRLVLQMKKHRGPPATSGSDVWDDSSRPDSDSDLQIIGPPSTNNRPKREQRPVKLSTKVNFRPAGPTKPRPPRILRPMLQAYGVVVPIDDTEFNGEKDPLQCHRFACGVCLNSPAHAVVQINKNKEFAKMGGWIRCMHCTEAVHWKCLSPVEQAEILKAARQREKQANAMKDNVSGSTPPERQSINFDEMTDYICAACNQGGICFECHHNLKTDSRVASVQEGKSDAVTTHSGEGSGPGDTAVERASFGEQAPTELLFRCVTCRRAAHYAHLRSPWTEENGNEPGLMEELAIYYQIQYSWQCDECSSYNTAAVDKIIAWRPYPPNAPILSPEEVADKRIKDPWPREYLVKWVEKSYRRVSWVPHLWLVSTAYQKLRHFILHGSKARLEHLRIGHDEEEMARRRVYEVEDAPPLPNPRAEECIPDPWKRVEQVLDVKLWAPHKRLKSNQRKKTAKRSVVIHCSSSEAEEEVDAEELGKLKALRERSYATGVLFLNPDCLETPLARKRRNDGNSLQMADIDDVVWCYAKWGDLEYQDATWDTPPKRGDPEWGDFEAAFARYIQSQSVFVARMSNEEIKKRDNRDPKKFAQNKMEVTKSFVADKGLDLRPFQVDGVNWLSYQWWRRCPAILADEMGLGKTIQIITFIAKLVEKKVWPHLVVVPNSTILNWTREFQTWAPDVRAVPYYGDAASRDVIRRYEIFQSGATSGQTKLKLHVLITTYETFLTKPEWAAVFRAPTRWETLIIDEGQRLKNNASLLFQRLNTINVGHRVLMTGTPLNNNLRELFNLMNFLDPENWPDVEELEREYHPDLLTPAHVAELHERLKQYFLRRTKEILKLPQKHELIVPVSLSKLQKGIYKSLIESNLSLLNTLVSSGPTTKTSKTNLRNILMQSRKCVQHPYLIDNDLEPVAKSNLEMHRQLIDASGKLKFLEIMLRNLKARGRRVLLFSQFVIALDIIEDFIVGEGYNFLRLDGDLKGSLRQKDIDKFNAPNSEYFIYLLSTRAGGVGINLATADTVIIFDPDFNPHQDAQAIARAHRFGQKKPVIVFRMMAVTGPEKKIMNAGKKKLLLDHVIVQSMEDEESAEDLGVMLLSGAKGLFEGGDENDIVYTESSVDQLIENAIREASKPKSDIPESSGLSFEFAQIWESSTPMDEGNELEGDGDFWSKMIAKAQEEKEKIAAQEVAKSGRGAQRRAKAAVTYKMAFEDSPQKMPSRAKGKNSDDVDYYEQDPSALTDAHTDATSEEDGTTPFELLQIVQGEVKELDESNAKAMEDKERRNRARRERRQQQKLLREKERLLAAQGVAEASAKIGEMVHGTASINATGTYGPPVRTGRSFPTAYSQPASGAAYITANSSAHLPHESVPLRPVGTIPNPLAPHGNSAKSHEPVCSLCKTRHGMSACPAVQTLADLKALRVKLLNSNEYSSEGMFALQCLDEDIARREAEQARVTPNRQSTGPALHVNASESSSKSVQPGFRNQTHSLSETLGRHKNLIITPAVESRPLTTYPQTFGVANALGSNNTSAPNGNHGFSSQPGMKKRPFDGPIPNERPTKKVNIGETTPTVCFLCNQPFHPVMDCKIMSADPARMKQRLDQLAANQNPAAQPAIQMLMRQYNAKLHQAARPATKYINISD